MIQATAKTLKNALQSGTKRISVAPMIDWTTRDFRAFARLFNPHIHLYSEMISTSAILHGDAHSHLRTYDNENPVVLQLGGANPSQLAQAAKRASAYPYSAINLNVGCPSGRVQLHKIGACLMAEPTLVSDCIRAMQDATHLPISVKHRIGIDHFDSYEFMAEFVQTVSQAGCQHFIVHARIAWLDGLSPKANRDIPPLRYEDVYRLKKDFPMLFIEINGGIKTLEAIKMHLQHVDGVMIGREVYHNPYFLAQCMALWGESSPGHRQIFDHLLAQLQHNNTPILAAARHYLGLFHGLKGARRWRQQLSGQKSLSLSQIDQAGQQLLDSNGL